MPTFKVTVTVELIERSYFTRVIGVTAEDMEAAREKMEKLISEVDPEGFPAIESPDPDDPGEWKLVDSDSDEGEIEIEEISEFQESGV